MGKIPLERTIESAYRFAFTNFFSVLGVLWLPFLAVCAVVAGIVYLTWNDLSHLHEIGLQASQLASADDTLTQDRLAALITLGVSVARFGGLVFLSIMLARAMVTVGVLRKALGLHEGPVFAYFSLGAPVWRMLGAMILVFLIVVGAIIGTCIAVGLVVWAAGYAPDNVRHAIRALAIFVGVLWMIYMTFRLVFFLPAVVVAENTIGISRAWQLGGGNFWRIILVLIAVLLPVAIVAGIISNAIFGSFLWTELHYAIESGDHMNPEHLFNLLAASLKNVLPFFVVFEIAYITLLTGLGLGAMASAYRSVTEAPEAQA